MTRPFDHRTPEPPVDIESADMLITSSQMRQQLVLECLEKMTKTTEILVIGAGPGGYVAAIRAAQLGNKVTLIEKDRVGGECLNYGCIPSKALITAARLVERMRNAGSMGIYARDVTVDFSKLQSWKNSVVDDLTSGTATLCRGHNIEVVKGTCEFADVHTVNVSATDGDFTIEAERILVATGSVPVALPKFPIDEKRVVTSRTALEFPEIPRKLLVVGGGVIGMEIGMMYSKLGSEVTIVELTETLLPGTDPDLVRVVSRTLRRTAVRIHLLSKVLDYRQQGDEVEVSVQTPEGPTTIVADRILLSVGRRPNTDHLGLGKAGVRTDAKGWITVNNRLQTNVPHIYAIGDVIGPPMLAHKASKEGIVAAEAMTGLPSALDYKAMPYAIFTDPEIASVGLTEKDARGKGYEPLAGRFPFSASGRAKATGESQGFVKVITDKESHLVLGVHIVGPDASNMIGEAALAIEMAATADDIALTIHPHPSLSESLMEAAEDVYGKAIHILKL